MSSQTMDPPAVNGHSHKVNGVRTYRGRRLEELIPTIRAELGADAIILREREGLVGGVGGFFAQRFIEVQARPGAPKVDLYDDEESPDPDIRVPPAPKAPPAAPPTARPIARDEPEPPVLDELPPEPPVAAPPLPAPPLPAPPAESEPPPASGPTFAAQLEQATAHPPDRVDPAPAEHRP